MTETMIRDETQIACVTLPKARERVVFDPAWCRTCRVCELACAIGKEGEARPAVARIAVRFDEFDPEVPIVGTICFQCADAPCMTACRVGAMVRDSRTGAVLIIEEKCVGCMRCNKACPWSVPTKHPDRKLALKCDLCSDRPEGPRCVEMCPLKGRALRYERNGAEVEDR